MLKAGRMQKHWIVNMVHVIPEEKVERNSPIVALLYTYPSKQLELLSFVAFSMWNSIGYVF
jgi:hypothetical protein